MASYSLESTPSIPNCCYEYYDCLPKDYKLLQTPLVRSAKEKGCKTVWSRFAGLNEPSEDVWVTIQFLSAIIIFGFSLGLVLRGHNTGYDYVRLSFSIAFLLYATSDAVARMAFRLAGYCSYVDSKDYIDPEVPSEEDNKEHLEEIQRTNIDDVIVPTGGDKSAKNKSTAEDVMNSRNKIELRKKSKWCLNGISKIRYIVIDLFLYPIFICHVMKYAADRSHEVLDFSYKKYEGAFFLVFAGIYVLLVYITRLAILGVSIWYIVEPFFPKDANDEKIWKLAFEKFFCFKQCVLPFLFLHTLFQFIFQMVIFCLIWFVAEHEFDMSRGTIRISSGFWFLVVMGYLVPVLGILSYFIPVCYNVEDLFVSITEREAELKMEDETLKKKHKEAVTTPYNWFIGIVYSFVSVPLTVLSIMYTIVIVVFILISVFLFFNGERDNIPLGWVIYLIVFVILANIFNIRVLCTVYLSILVVTLVLCVILAVVAVVTSISLAIVLIILFLGFMCVACQGDSRRK